MNAFGRYEIVRRIGVGGMGEVFFAWAYGVARTRKPVVVKVLRSEMLSEPGAPEMFVEEGRLSLHLNHMNILQVFDFGKADDRYFMAMEFVDGLHLGELRKKAGGRLNPDLAAFVIMEVCLALDYAHRLKDETGKPMQIIHRDVTPSNVLISREGEVKLADFGIARAVGRSQHTQAGQIRGKVRYMSPEAARGEPLDHRADLFSLGAILFELLTGRRAFDAKGGREAILKQIVSTRAPAPSMAGLDIHPALDAVVVKALAPRREERFPDAFAFHRAIDEGCREAGLRPSRGAFLEFLRNLEAAAAAAEANSWSDQDGPPPAQEPIANISLPTPGGRPGVEGTAAVPPPSMSAAGVVPELASSRNMPTVTPGAAAAQARGSRPSKPSSTSGPVPPVIEGPQSTVLPTGVAAPVLFTLVMGERTPAVEGQELPVFDVTREGLRIDLDSLPPGAPIPDEPEPVERIGSDRIAPLDAPSGEKTIPPLVSGEKTIAPRRGSAPQAVPSAPDRTQSRSGSAEVSTDPARAPVEIERPTVDRPTPSTSAPRIERQSGGSTAETVVRPGSNSLGAAAPRPGSARGSPVPASAEPGYRAPTIPADTRETGDPHWRVRRQEVAFDTPAPVEDELPAVRRRSRSRGANPVVYAAAALGVLAVALYSVNALRSERADPTPAATPRRTAVVVATPPAGLSPTPTEAEAAATGRVRPTEIPPATPLETRIAVAPSPAATRPRVTPTPRMLATPPPAAQEPGLLVLNTQPWTEFTIAGRQLHTPVNGEKIPPGHYTVALHNKYNPKLDRTIEVDVRSGATTRIILDLTHP